MAQKAGVAEQGTIMGHPKGLFVLFFTEMWERFSYYGMRAILTLYMVHVTTEASDSGLGWSTGKALALYGWYTMLVYVASIPGGILADRVFGQKRAVLIGGLILVAGHGILAIEAEWAFYSGLLLIILGVGLLKPNISTMVGQLYPPGDTRRDKGFTIFYIGINLGALLAAFIVGAVAETYGWHYGFGLAGIGMAFGQLVYMYGQKHLKGIGEPPAKTSKQVNVGASHSGEPEVNLFKEMFKSPLNATLAAICIPVGVLLGLVYSPTLGFFAGTLLFVISFFGAMSKDLNKIEKDRVTVMLVSFLIVIVFWGAFEQAGGLMSIYTDQKIDRFIGSWEVPASMFQGVNAGFIIMFGSLVAMFWGWWANRGKESSSIFKMAVGVIIMGMGFIFMAIAAREAGSEPFGKGALIWLILAYLLHTLGELCASPVALSFITKLSPARYVSIMMGVYFAATGFGNKLAGTIGEQVEGEYASVEMHPVSDGTVDILGDTSYSNRILKDEAFTLRGQIIQEGEGENASFKFISNDESAIQVDQMVTLDSAGKQLLVETIKPYGATAEEPAHFIMTFERDKDSTNMAGTKGSGRNYSASIIVDEAQGDLEKKIFWGIFIFCAAFGVLVLFFLKRLKKLTHGAEDVDAEPFPEDGYSEDPRILDDPETMGDAPDRE